jgi:predicted proteasome-type protease
MVKQTRAESLFDKGNFNFHSGFFLGGGIQGELVRQFPVYPWLASNSRDLPTSAS